MPKKVKKTTKIVEQDIDYMVDPSASFVSLVSHGANGESFFVVKSKGKDENRVIQRVIVPKSLDKKEADALLEKFSTEDERDFPSHLAYDQIPVDQCVPDSFQVVKLNKAGTLFGVVGELANPEKVKSISKSDNKEVALKQIDSNTRWDISDESYAMERLIMSVAYQSKADTGWQKATMLMAVDNFKSFLETALASVDAKSLVSSRGVIDDIKKEMKTNTQIQEEPMEIDEKKLTDVVRKCLDDVIAEKASDAEAKKAREDKAKSEKDFKDSVNKMVETVADLAKRLEAIESSAPASGTEEVDEDVDKKEHKNADEKSVDPFAGLLFAPAE